MARRPLTSEQIPLHPLRRAVLRHLAAIGGDATAAALGAAVGIAHRESMDWHARILERGDYVTVNKIARRTRITLTRKGAAAINDKQSLAMEL